MDPIELSVFASRISAACDEMGAVLKRAAFSPNIKDRLDFSCAVFDPNGALCAQAAHIPVHLGSMAYAMADLVAGVAWRPGDMVFLNDPYKGGTHLPDVTVIAPLFVDEALMGFVANRAHHADIGAETPGSMPIARSLDDEGVVIAPTHVMREGRVDDAALDAVLTRTRNPAENRGDFAAQISANRAGLKRLEALVASMSAEGGAGGYQQALAALNAYGERLAAGAIEAIPDGTYRFRDVMDDDGLGCVDIPIEATLAIEGGRAHVDFTGTASQVPGNINCPLSVAAAAVYYVFRCLMPPQTPACAGSFRPITLTAPDGCLLNARPPAAVAAGNVETSTRVVDVVTGALAQAVPDQIPAASHGSMNNIALGGRVDGRDWDYYETMGGGMGAGAHGGGLSGVHTHMTNTLNTPIEAVELHYPLRVLRYGLRRASGGAGVRPGGDGLVREFLFLAPASATLLTERRRHRPWGVAGGGDAQPGRNFCGGHPVAGKVTLEVQPGERLRVESAGGGGWGSPQ